MTLDDLAAEVRACTFCADALPLGPRPILRVSTTATIQGREVDRYLGVVFGDTVLGVNFLKDFLGSIHDFVGGRSGTYERELGTARDSAMRELMEQAQALGADAERTTA